MGWFSGGFLGGGTDESQTSSTTNTTSNWTENITTNTTSTMGDVGLTGQQAVDMAAVLGTISRDITQIGSNVQVAGVRDLLNASRDIFGDTAKTLAGIQGSAVSSSMELINEMSKREKDYGVLQAQVLGEMNQSRSQEYERMVNISGGLLNPDLAVAQQNQKMWMIVAVVGIGAIFLMRRK